MSAVPVTIPQTFLESFCRHNHIHRLSLFGSVLTPRFRSDSDIDMLVEFEPGHVPGYFEMARMEMELSKKLGRKVDLRTPAELSRYFRDQVVSTAIPTYERS